MPNYKPFNLKSKQESPRVLSQSSATSLYDSGFDPLLQRQLPQDSRKAFLNRSIRESIEEIAVGAVGEDMIPLSTSTYDLGSSAKKWAELYLSGLASIGGNAVVGGTLGVTGKATLSGEIEIDGALNHDGTTIGFFGTAPATKTSVADITDSSGGTSGSGTIAAIGIAVTDPADTPASADALRDDLVANTIPSIETELSNLRNAVATIAARMNDILNALQSYGIV